MMKRFKPSERNARPNQVIQIQARFTIRSQASSERGAFQYLKSQPPTKHLKLVIGKGQYIGDLNCINAFVWLDDEVELKAA
jgi:hypothetical protein